MTKDLHRKILEKTLRNFYEIKNYNKTANYASVFKELFRNNVIEFISLNEYIRTYRGLYVLINDKNEPPIIFKAKYEKLEHIEKQLNMLLSEINVGLLSISDISLDSIKNIKFI